MNPPRSFEEARVLVEQAQTWKLGPGGAYMVASWGEEDDTRYRVIIGTPEVLLDNRVELTEMDVPVVFVDKTTGAITLATYLEVMDQVDTMRPVGAAPPKS